MLSTIGVQVVESARERLGIRLSNAVLAAFRRLRQLVGKGRGQKMSFEVSAGYLRGRAFLLTEQRDRAPKVHGLFAGLVLRERAGEFARFA
jgi:hypothetical protein